MPVQPVYGYGYPAAQAYSTSTVYSGYAAPTQMPVYSASTHGMPVNVRHGAVLTEARGIFIQNLSYKCTLSDLYSLLLTVGQPVDHKLIRDRRTGVFKGAATAAFASKEAAQHAAQCSHGQGNNGCWASWAAVNRGFGHVQGKTNDDLFGPLLTPSSISRQPT
jgi:RNA recognition motif-containing protein